MGRYTARNNGCLTNRRQCPCGDEQCYIRVDEDKEDPLIEPVGETNATISLGAPQTSSEITTVYRLPCVGQSFQTDDEAEEYYTNFARQNGFAIRREHCNGSAGHPLGVYRRDFVCYRAGKSRQKADKKRMKKSARCECPAQMVIKKNIKKGASRWVVSHFSNTHNHDFLDSEELRLLPAYRNISAIDRERILFLSRSGVKPTEILKSLEKEKGVNRSEFSFTEKDLRNFLASSKNMDPANEGSELLKACKVMKEKNPEFRYEFTIDSANRLEHVLWSYPESICAYKVFGDVVVFDTTYHLYTYNRPIGVWSGLDNNGNTIFFGCVLLQDERPQSFRWALQSFVRLMDGKCPQTMLTDLDLQLKEAILSELPTVKHAFSIWHILPKLSGWFSASLGSQYEKFISEFSRIYKLERIEDFEDEWRQMVVDFGLCSDRHIHVLSYHRNLWAFPYLRGCFFGGLMATGFSSSIKSFLKGFLNSETPLKDFIQQIGYAADSQYRAGEDAIMRQNYQPVQIKTCVPIEEHAMSVLSPYAFDMFQKEIVKSAQYAVFETSSDTFLVQHHQKPDGGGLVRCDPSDGEIYCRCQGFEASGILCRHALRVLSLKNCFKLPEKYLLARWRRESSLTPKSSGYKHRFQALHTLASTIVQESSRTRDRFDYAQRHMSKLLAHVRYMPTVEESSAMQTIEECTVVSTVVEPAMDMEQSSSCDAVVDALPVQTVAEEKLTFIPSVEDSAVVSTVEEPAVDMEQSSSFDAVVDSLPAQTVAKEKLRYMTTVEESAIILTIEECAVVPTTEEPAMDMEQSSSCDAVVDALPAQPVAEEKPNGVEEVVQEALDT